MAPLPKLGGYNSVNATQQTETNPVSTTLMYCWSCGLNRMHNGTQCPTRKRKLGHKEEATVDNMMGGNNIIKRISGEYPAPPFHCSNNNNNNNSTSNDHSDN